MKNATKILKDYSFLGQHNVETNNGHFILEYKKIVPTLIGEEPRIKVTFQKQEETKSVPTYTIEWNSNSCVDEQTIIKTIK
mgnify:CR=1 FL=1|tara:strand:- start:2421 stop:2663 length:243 start_codon:yes stop_codon:yes gene_type:complete